MASGRVRDARGRLGIEGDTEPSSQDHRRAGRSERGSERTRSQRRRTARLGILLDASGQLLLRVRCPSLPDPSTRVPRQYERCHRVRRSGLHRPEPLLRHRLLRSLNSKRRIQVRVRYVPPRHHELELPGADGGGGQVRPQDGLPYRTVRRRHQHAGNVDEHAEGGREVRSSSEDRRVDERDVVEARDEPGGGKVLGTEGADAGERAGHGVGQGERGG
mmetsp:Transcript_9529/g.17947  ORF Transcript_9529/g.17947 Transcript_9529/m.17947 type:complete len:218 (+) Transcript_9529:512-1165(+)